MIVALAALQHSIATRVRMDAPTSFSEALDVVRGQFQARHSEAVGETAGDVLELAERVYTEAVAEIRSMTN